MNVNGSRATLAGYGGAALMRNTMFSVLGWLWPITVYLVAMPFIVGRLGVERYGIYSLLLLLVGYTGALSTPMAQANVMYVARALGRGDWHVMGETISTSLAIQAFLAAVAGLSMFFAADWLATHAFRVRVELAQEATYVLRVGGITIALTILMGVFSGIAQGLQRFGVFNGITAGVSTINTVIVVVLLAHGFGLRQIVLAQPVATVLGIVVFACVSSRLLPDVRWFNRITWGLLADMGGFALWIFVNQLCSLLAFEAGKTIVAVQLGSVQLAYFTVASSMAGLLQALGARLSLVFFPLSATLVGAGALEQLRDTYLKAMRVFIFVVGGIAMGYVALGSLVLRYWMGPEFGRNAYPPLVFLAGWGLWHALGAIPHGIANGTNHPRINALFSIAFGLTNILGVLPLARYGPVGIAVGSLLSTCVVSPLYIGYIHRRILHLSNRVAITEIAIPYLVSASCAAAASRLMGSYVQGFLGFLVLCIMTGLAYLILSLLSGLITRDELHNLQSRVLGVFGTIFA